MATCEFESRRGAILVQMWAPPPLGRRGLRPWPGRRPPCCPRVCFAVDARLAFSRTLRVRFDASSPGLRRPDRSPFSLVEPRSSWDTVSHPGLGGHPRLFDRKILLPLRLRARTRVLTPWYRYGLRRAPIGTRVALIPVPSTVRLTQNQITQNPLRRIAFVNGDRSVMYSHLTRRLVHPVGRGGSLLIFSLGFLSLLLVALTPAIAAQLRLDWEDNSGNENGFKIWRAEPGGTYAQIAARPSNATSYVDTTVTAGVTYCYQVLAYNDAGESAPSNEACKRRATPPATLPRALRPPHPLPRWTHPRRRVRRSQREVVGVAVASSPPPRSARPWHRKSSSCARSGTSIFCRIGPGRRQCGGIML